MTTVDVPITDSRGPDLEPLEIGLWWLGQAGFLFRTREHALVVDPYLSDSLAEKYRTKPFKHKRMMPIPIAPSALTGLTWIFSSHRHTDHMDSATLVPLIAANPGCRFFCPAAAADLARDVIGIAGQCTTLLDVHDHLRLADGIEVDVLAAAHEMLQYDDAGHSDWLGFVFDINGTKIYHSGDCVPYHGLVETLSRLKVDLALLPVNGRDEQRRRNGVPGNFTFDEATSLCRAAGITALVPHHFGMFEFNTIDLQQLRKKAKDASAADLQVVLPEIHKAVLMRRHVCPE